MVWRCPAVAATARSHMTASPVIGRPRSVMPAKAGIHAATVKLAGGFVPGPAHRIGVDPLQFGDTYDSPREVGSWPVQYAQGGHLRTGLFQRIYVVSSMRCPNASEPEA